jgi:hypothetical protein
MSLKEIDDKPWLESKFGYWQINLPAETKAIINCSANQTIEIDKLYGPLSALGVRIRLEYTSNTSDWVVEREKAVGNIETTWVEVARWDCQLDWFKEKDTN